MFDKPSLVFENAGSIHDRYYHTWHFAYRDVMIQRSFSCFGVSTYHGFSEDIYIVPVKESVAAFKPIFGAPGSS